MEWHSLHAVYYDENKDTLVLEGVRPLFHQLKPHVAAASYTRHWRQGPHLRLHLLCDCATMTEIVRPAAEDIIGGFLTRHPSRAQLVPEEHLEAHQRSAALEHETGPLLPWRPDNSLHEAPFDRRVDVLGSEEAADLLADFYADTTELAFRMTEDIVRGRQRLDVAFDLMILTAHVLSGKRITGGFVSFRSHAEGFLSAFPEAKDLRPRWDEHYRRHAASLGDRVEQIVTAIDDGTGTVDFAEDWIDVLRSYRRRGRRLLARGRLSMDPPPLPDNAGMPDLNEVSPFHRALAANPEWPAVMNSDWFTLYRLMLNYTYLHMTRLGITPAERFLLCHLAASAVEDRYGISVMERLRQASPTSAPDSAAGGSA